MENFQTPILFVVFNRYSTAIQVFNKIREIKPKKLYIAADGRRKTHKDDKQKCEKVRSIAKLVDWDCELKTLFREENIGCGKGVYSAVNWLFENEDRGIILEDDVLPIYDFFVYCDDLLERYKDNDKIKAISGNDYGICPQNQVGSYWYSSIFHVWGWATWRRAWKDYEFDLKKYSRKQLRDFYRPYSVSFESKMYWYYRAMQMYYHTVDAWDYQAEFWIWRTKGLCIQPVKPLITNIGMEKGTDKTHEFKDPNSMKFASQNILPLKYNDKVVQDKEADLRFHKQFNRKAIWKYPILHFLLLFKKRKF